METSELLEFLCNQLKNEEGLPWLSGYSGSYREDTLPNGSFTTKEIGVWLWVKAELDLDGSTMDQTSGVSGDPYEANVEYHWIGLAANAPEKVSIPEDLDKWAKLSTRYVCENNDSGYWGSHSGKWVEDLLEDGTVTLRVASGRYQDVPPASTTSTEEVKLEP